MDQTKNTLDENIFWIQDYKDMDYIVLLDERIQYAFDFVWPEDKIKAIQQKNFYMYKTKGNDTHPYEDKRISTIILSIIYCNIKRHRIDSSGYIGFDVSEILKILGYKTYKRKETINNFINKVEHLLDCKGKLHYRTKTMIIDENLPFISSLQIIKKDKKTYIVIKSRYIDFLCKLLMVMDDNYNNYDDNP